MKKALLTLLLAFMSLTHAGVGDVYYCVMERSEVVYGHTDGHQLELNNFIFKWEEGQVSVRNESDFRVLPIVFEGLRIFNAVHASGEWIEYMNFRDERFQRVQAVNGAPEQSIVTSTGSCTEYK